MNIKKMCSTKTVGMKKNTNTVLKYGIIESNEECGSVETDSFIGGKHVIKSKLTLAT